MKKRRWQSILSVLTSVALVAGLSPVGAFAVEGVTPDDNARAADGAKTELALTVQAPGDGAGTAADPLEMALGESYDVSVEEGGYWVGVFTASDDGMYVFASSGSEDTYGHLYSDAALEYEIRYNDDGGNGNNFSISQSLSEGQTVYLKARQCNDEAADFAVSVTVLDTYDIAGPYWGTSWGTDVFAYSGEPVEGPEVSIYRYDSDTEKNVYLEKGTHYQARYAEEDGQTALDGAPVEPGYYYAIYEGIAPYHGQFETQFRIIDTYDAANITMYVDKSTFTYKEGVTQEPALSFLDYFGDPIEDITYTVKWWDSEADDYVDEITQEVDGYYEAQITLEAPYQGTFEGTVAVAIVASNDLAAADVEVERLVAATGDDGDYVIQNPAVSVRMDGTELSEGEHYTVGWLDDNGYEVDGPLYPDAPYTLVVKAKEGSDYTGQYSLGSYYLQQPESIYNAEADFPNGYDFTYTGGPVDLGEVLTYDGETLERDVDYTLTFYGYDDYEENYYDGNATPIATPVEVGRYVAVIAGQGRFRDTTNVYFSIIKEYDAYDLEFSELSRSYDAVAGSFSDFEYNIYMTDEDGYHLRDLNEGVDYEIVRYEVADEGQNWTTVDDIATAGPGSYRMVIGPAEGSDYRGEKSFNFNMLDPNDLRYAEWEVDDLAIASGDPANPVNPVSRVMLYGVELEYGVDYDLVFCKAEDWDFDEGYVDPSLELTSVYEEGSYMFRLVPAAGSDYTQSYGGYLEEAGFTLVGANSLKLADVTIESPVYTNRTDDTATPEITVTLDGQAVSPDRYVVNYKPESYYDDDLEEWVYPEETLAPLSPGRYDVVIAPAEGSDLTGEAYGSVEVYSVFELDNEYFDLDQGQYAYTGDPVQLDVSLRAADGVDLVEGADYQLVYYDEDNDIELAGAPSDAGSYSVYAEGIAPYRGTTGNRYFKITDSKDLRFAAADAYSWRNYIGELAPSSFYVRDADGNLLIEGTHYTITGFERWDDDLNDGDGGYVDAGVTGAADIAVPGEYRFLFAAVPGGGYTGSSESDSFEVFDPKDLTNASVRFSGNTIVDSTGAYAPALTIELRGNTLVEGMDYTATYYAGEDEQEPCTLPLRPGEYMLKIAPADGSSYHGSYSTLFEVYAATDLSVADIDRDRSSYPYTEGPVVIQATVTAADGTVLEEGADYVAVFYGEYGELLSGAPTAIGDYYVQFRAIGDTYSGETYRMRFSIVDMYDLSKLDGYMMGGSFFVGEMPGNFDPVLQSYDYESELVEGTDFSIDGYEKYNSASGEWVAVPGFDGTVAGEYRIVLAGIAPYHGKTTLRFDVKDAKDLANAEIDYEWRMVANGQPLNPVTSVVLDGVPLVEGTDYTVEFFVEGSVTPLAGAPTEPGTYPFRLVPVAGSGYTQSNPGSSNSFIVKAANDLSLANCYQAEPAVVSTAGGKATPQVTVELGGVKLIEGTDYTVAYYDVPPERGGKPLSTPLGVGHYFAYVTAVSGGSYAGMTSSDVYVKSSTSIADATISLPYRVEFYAGQDQTPDYSLTVEAADGTELAAGTDYVAEYYVRDDEGRLSDKPLAAAPMTAGRYEVVVKGKGAYAGEQQRSFTIVDLNDLANYWPYMPQNNTYTGSPITNPKVSFARSSYEFEEPTILDASAYRVVGFQGMGGNNLSSAPTDSGTYYAVVEGVAPYHGTNKAVFRIIAPDDLALATVAFADGSEFVYAGSAITPAFKVTMPGADGTPVEVPASAYTVTYDWNGTTVAEPVKIGWYQMKITAVEGSGYTGEVSATFRINEAPVQKIDIADATVTVSTATYTGAAQQPAVTVFLGGRQLVANADYMLEYGNYVNAGPALVTIRGIGNYEGALPWGYTIERAKIAAPVAKSGLVYNGKAQTGVAAGANYTVKNGSATNAGTYTATATADANHVFANGAATASVKFTIAKAKVAVPAAKTGLVYTGKALTGVAAGAGYTVAKGSATNAGTYTATATADANHVFANGVATASVKFTIAKKANTLKAKAVKKTQKAAYGKKVTIKAKKAFKVTKNVSKGKVTYKLKSAPKKVKKKITVSKTGTITVKKGTPKGTYTIKVALTSKATTNYKAATKNVSLKIKVA